MITATVIITTTPTSLRDLINTAVPGRIPVGSSGRAFQIILIPSAITVVISDDPSTPTGAGGVALTATAIAQYNFLAPTGNQLALEEIFLSSAAGGETVGVIAFTL